MNRCTSSPGLVLTSGIKHRDWPRRLTRDERDVKDKKVKIALHSTSRLARHHVSLSKALCCERSETTTDKEN